MWTNLQYRIEPKLNFIEWFPACNLKPKFAECQTDGLLIEGAHGWTPTMYIRLVQDFGLECETAQHLAQSYGDRAFAVAKLASLTGKRWPIIGKKIHPEFPYIDAEVREILMKTNFYRLSTPCPNRSAECHLPTVLGLLFQHYM